jgi:hypothetical protein
VCQFLLAETDACVSQADILAVVLAGIVEVGFASDVISFAFVEEKRILQMTNIGTDGIVGDLTAFRQFLPGIDGICYVGYICQGTNGRSKEIYNSRENLRPCDFFPFNNILDLDFCEESS